MRLKKLSLLAVAVASAVLPMLGQAQTPSIESILVTARLREEDVQKVPVSVSVVGSDLLERTATDNLSQIARLVPSLSYVSPNPRNTAFTIRGLGSSVVAISQANDGLEPGVGFYVDGVYHARPATAAFDFSDLERVEVLRGPQGTLFGKNTTAGAINIVSQAPGFTHEVNAELSTGEFGWLQGKGSIGGSIVDGVVAGRMSVIATRRDGVIRNVTTGRMHNDIDNLAVRTQLLFPVSDALQWRLSTDYSSFDNNCCTQVYFGVGTTLKTANKQYPALAAGRNYTPPSLNPYDRLTDIDADLAVNTSEGGVALTGDLKLDAGTITSISAWRYWNWDAANDRDYTGLSIQTFQHIPSRQDQYSQELRFTSKPGVVDYVGGLYFFTQTITGRPITIYGPVATYWLLGPSTLPDSLLDGYGTDGHTRFKSNSYAGYGELTWHVNSAFSVSGGLRYTKEDKDGSFDSTVSGGLANPTAAQLTSKLSILRPQSYVASVSDGSLTGRLNLSYQLNDDVMFYSGYSRGSKSGGINMSGLPLNASNLPALDTAIVKPEKNTTYELGVKTELFNRRAMLNADVYYTTVKDFQANVVDTGPGALRGYLANIQKVRVQGAEVDFTAKIAESFTTRFSLNWTDGKYASYVNGPCPLDRVGNSTAACDLSGLRLSSQPKLSAAAGAEYSHATTLAGASGDAFVRLDLTARSSTYGDPADSKALLIGGYSVLNASAGFRQKGPWEVQVWARNLTDREYMQNLTVQAGNSGLIVGTPGDERMFGATVRVKY